MVSWTQNVDQSNSGVDDSLQWRYRHVRQPGEQSVAVVESCEQCGDEVGGDVTTK